MCYPCTECNLCGKFNEGNPCYREPAKIPCLKCGGEVDGETGLCTACGMQVFIPPTSYKKSA